MKKIYYINEHNFINVLEELKKIVTELKPAGFGEAEKELIKEVKTLMIN